MHKRIWFSLVGIVAALTTCTHPRPAVLSAPVVSDTYPAVDLNPSAVYLSPEESLKTMYLPSGYHLELVASEPMIKEPVAIAWDGNARLYVAEMLTYMQDADFTGEQEPRSRISLLEDTDNDGRMDKSTVFIDSLLLPRMLLCVDHELLVNETNTINVWSYRDTNGDGKADTKKLAYRNDQYKVNDANMEHQRSGMDWNLDNWIYLTYDPIRWRYRKGMLTADTLTSGAGGQWGVTHDNYGRLFYSRAGGELPALGFQINPVYGTLDFPDQYDAEFSEVFPIIATPDVQGGPMRLRPDSTLNHFTAPCGQSIFRGDRLPPDLAGDYLVCEPVARSIRRADVLAVAGKRVLQNTYPRREFIASSDMNFRPVNTYTGPDGCLYIVDMHRGIVQQGNWTRPGSFLRQAIDARGLAKNTGHGRIYRLVHDGYQRSATPHMLDEPVTKLVTYLDHPNGWWRDNAQKQLIALDDHSVVPALKQLVAGQQASLAKTPGHLARIHALWTLDGLGALDKATLLTALNDPHEQVRKTAVWASEPYLKQGDQAILERLQSMQTDSGYDVRSQLILSLHSTKSPKAKAITDVIARQNEPSQSLVTALQTSLQKNDDVKAYGRKLGMLPETDRNLILAGAATFKSLCATCHGSDGKGLSIGGGPAAAPPLAGSKRVYLLTDKSVVTNILLHGLSGPVDGKTYADMPSMAANSDDWIASVLSYIRYEFGGYIAGPVSAASRPAGATTSASGTDKAGFITRPLLSPVIKPDEVKKLRAETATRQTPWTLAELEAKAVR